MPDSPGFSIDGDMGEVPYQEYRWPDDSTDHITNIYVTYTEGDPPEGCGDPVKFNIKDIPDKCKKMLTQVIYNPDHCELLQASPS